ncbi:hypothetical protein [Sciscionella sediminilitoris]|uniref:hypothetical protein n=1 Tax=Sciscionella sediminilitoris TaxID=1445613 RepID=UPI0018D1178B|nr:hypothetical protein [Sciscionella sp. SE31]
MLPFGRLDEHLPRDWSAFGEVDVLVDRGAIGEDGLSAYRLGPRGYELVSEYTGDSAIRIDGIATVPVDLDALAERS